MFRPATEIVHAASPMPAARVAAAPEPAPCELAHRVRLFLANSNLPNLRRIEVRVDGNTVELNGKVRTFYEKQLAARLSHRVAGVMQVIDRLEVCHESQHDLAANLLARNHRHGSRRPS